MHKILFQIARVGVCTKPPPAPDEALRQTAVRINQEMLRLLRG